MWAGELVGRSAEGFLGPQTGRGRMGGGSLTTGAVRHTPFSRSEFGKTQGHCRGQKPLPVCWFEGCPAPSLSCASCDVQARGHGGRPRDLPFLRGRRMQKSGLGPCLVPCFLVPDAALEQCSGVLQSPTSVRRRQTPPEVGKGHQFAHFPLMCRINVQNLTGKCRKKRPATLLPLSCADHYPITRNPICLIHQHIHAFLASTPFRCCTPQSGVPTRLAASHIACCSLGRA